MANQELAHQPVNGGAMVTATHFQDEMLGRLSVVKDVIAKGCTDVELQFFAEVCKRTGLDPFMKQIYCIKRGSGGDDEEGASDKKITIQTGIDGFRIIAERTGKYDGQSEAQWCGDDGRWVDVWGYDNPPVAARVGVYRKDWNRPAWGVAHYIEYVQLNRTRKPTRMWLKMPAGQLAKCAEALALRKAFPMELSGLYTNDEMAQSSVIDEPPVPGTKEAAQGVAEQKIETLRAQQNPPTETAKAEQPVARAEQNQQQPRPAVATPPLDPIERAMAEFRNADKYGRLKLFGQAKKDIEECTGAEADYYRILSEVGKVEKCDQFKSMGPATATYRALLMFLAKVTAEPPLPEPAKTDASATEPGQADGWMDGMSNDIDAKFEGATA